LSGVVTLGEVEMLARGAGPARVDEREATLVRRARDGDAEAFADLYECHLGQVYRYFYYRLGHHEDAEDLTEQTFLKVWQAIGSYDYRGSPFAAWVFRIAHNLLVDHRRRLSPTEELDDELEVEDSAAGPEEAAAQRLEAEELGKALRQLTDVEQSVVALRFVHGLEHRTVARIVGKSEVATRSIQSRALVRLERILRGAGGTTR
jgi:RNA polymerase sigma-70 factor, ECF subfamily